MRHRQWLALAALAGASLGLAWAVAQVNTPGSGKGGTAKPAGKAMAAAEVFGLGKVHAFDLQFTAAAWDTMQAVKGGMPFGGFGGFKKPGDAPKPPAEKPGTPAVEYHKNSGFGMEFPWTHGTLTTEGKTYKDVAVRYKGNASYMASTGNLKRNLKIELDRYNTDQRFHGLKTITLNAGAMDAGRLREAMAYAIFRAAGVPAPRTAFAEVTLTVPGKYDKEFVGVYTFIEHVDKTFLKNHFQTGKGVLMKPERVRGIDYFGEDWASYKDKYHPKHEPSKKEAKRVIAFARLVHKASDEQFQKEIGAYLDVDEFLRFLAANAFVVNMDSFYTMGHNFYLYLNPQTNKFVFIPWDLDLSFAGMPMMGGGQQPTDLSMTHPHPGMHKLIDRLLANKDVSAKYQKLLQELSATCFAKDRLLADLDTVEKTIKAPLAKEAKAVEARKENKVGFGFGPPGGMFGGKPFDMRGFLEKRSSAVVAQLADPKKGYVPTMGFGPGGGKPGGPGGPPGGFGPGMFMAKPVLAALDTDKDGKLSKEEWLAGVKKFFKETDKNGSGKLDNTALAAALNKLMPAPKGFGPPGGPGVPGGPGGPPGGFGPGNFLAAAIFKRADADKDGKVTLAELLTAAEKLFQDCDKKKTGKLDESGIATGINQLFPAPPGFGPPGGGVPGQPPAGKM